MDLRSTAAAVAVAVSAIAAAPSSAQTSKESVWDGTVIGFDYNSGGMLGDMGGLRSRLAGAGFNFNLVYGSESAANLHGGYNADRHLSYVDQLALLASQDLERYTGIPDARIELLVTNRNHDDNLTTVRLQDPRASFNDLSQEVWGGGSITRLGYLTFSRSFLGRRLHWRFGQMNYQQTFDQIAPCDFQLLSLCGGKSAYARSWDTWNIHTLGTTLAYDFSPSFTLKAGVLEKNDLSSQRGRSWSFDTRGSRGVLIPVEGQVKTTVNGLPGLVNLGVQFNNARMEELYTAPGQAARTRDRTWFMWGGFNQQITRRAGASNRGMSLSGQFALADQRTDPFHRVASLALRYRGLFDALPNDWIGLGVSWLDMSKDLASAQQQLNDRNGIRDFYDPAWVPVAGHSVNAELHYRFRPLGWLEIQPDLQYWIHPGAVRQTPNAVVIGLKTVVRF